MSCLVIALGVAGFLPYLVTLLVKRTGGFNRTENARTREWQATLTGWRQRAHWAHQNSFEGFPFYAAGVLAVMITAPTSAAGHWLAWGYVVDRVAYIACFIADKATLRTAVFFGGLGCCFGLYAVAASA